MGLLVRMPEGTSMLELWAGSADAPRHPFVPRGVEDAAQFLRSADPRDLRDAAIQLGGTTELGDESALFVVARAWFEGRLSLHSRDHVVGRTEARADDITNLSDLADVTNDPVEPVKTYIEIQVVFEGDLGCADAKVRVLTPDGDTHDGTLDGDSKIRIDDIAAGTCMLEFPEPLPLPDANASDATITPPTGRTARVARNGRVQLRAGASHLVIVPGPCFELAIDLGDASAWPAGSAMRLAGGPYDTRIELAAAPAQHGLSQFHFHGVRRGVDYTLTLEPKGGDAITLVDAKSLDPFLDVLGDRQAPIEPLELAAFTVPEPEPEPDVLASAGRPQMSDDLDRMIAVLPWDSGDPGTQLA